ncbi:hypothetical protein NDU88_002432 [Pleurodeles waltl]|uniref:Uncharacterized protein n=1 Tax=Pleurodeles waltl TaxID=8319 RepID=A0AAV7RBU4_PLEWA|nr:hypothetical protein NDU88_002432 [Pleurodeles waltl]
MLAGIGRLPGPIRCMAFLAPTTESIHPSVHGPSYRGADRPDMASGSGSLDLDFGPESDPAPILMSWGAPTQTQRPMWCFTAWYMKDPECVDFIDQELENYFRQNSRSEALAMTLWMARKPSMRGVSKGYIRQWEAWQAQWITGLESRIADLESRVQWSDRRELGSQLVLLCAEFWQVSLAEARQCWQASTQKVYELGDKTGKLVYWLVTCNVSSQVVPLIRNRLGSIQE